jgi:hypothetical protein
MHRRALFPPPLDLAWERGRGERVAALGWEQGHGMGSKPDVDVALALMPRPH